MISSEEEEIRMQGVRTVERYVKSTYLKLKPYLWEIFSMIIFTNTSAIN